MRPIARLALLLPSLLACLAAGPTFAACTNPTGNEADVKYNADYHTYQFCNGTTWLAYGGGQFCGVPGSYNPTTPSGSGYFVLTSTTYNGNLGGLSGADAACLTELTTNTGWMGYSTANSNGQLTSVKVHAFLCVQYECNNLMPLATYYFANAGNSGAGGASFTTDTNGLGPNDAANWSAANYFSGTYNYWDNRSDASSTVWLNTADSWIGSCSNFTSSSSGVSSELGNSAYIDFNRWFGFNNNHSTCDQSYRLICFVNP